MRLATKKTKRFEEHEDRVEYRVFGVVRHEGQCGRPPRIQRTAILYKEKTDEGYKLNLIQAGPGEFYANKTEYWPTWELAQKFARSISVGVS